MAVKYVLAALFAFLLVSGGAFAVAPSPGSHVSPVPFDQTVATGLTGVDVQRARVSGYDVPRAEVFFSQYRYVVGYYGVESAAAALSQSSTARQFGRPLAVFVTDYAGTSPRLADGGYVRLGNAAAKGWVEVGDAYFVVDSPARTPGGPTALPFSSRSEAAAFAREYGGSVVRWDAIRRRSDRSGPSGGRSGGRGGNASGATGGGTAGAATGGGPGAGSLAGAIRNRTAWADRRVASSRRLLDRPVSVVVGRDAPTVAAAVAAAPPNTTVEIPPGTYDVNLTVRKPITLRGAGDSTHLTGDGTGTVIRLLAPRTAISSVRITGVGPNGSAGAVPNGSGSKNDWDARVLAAYGYGDAAVTLDSANRSLVDRVSIDTPANGVIVRSSPGTVVRRLSLNGSATWQAGFMGVSVMRSRVVVQNSSFRGGRDGVYTHRANGLVVRDNRMSNLRFGVHEMYTSSALVRNNTVRGANVGLIVMTRPTGNALVDNDVRDSQGGISASGSAAVIAGNVLADDGVGLYVNGKRTRYERNTVVGNDVGIRSDTILPTNLVVDNDVVGNGAPVAARGGPVHIWSADGRGNYWGRLPATDRNGDGVYDREFRPTGPVDGVLHRSPGAATLARSPAVALLRSLETTVPGLRSAGVVDESPLVRPVRPAVLERITGNRTSPGGRDSPPSHRRDALEPHSHA